MATKKNNKSIWIMLALILLIVAALFLMPSCAGKGSSKTPDQTTLVAVGDEAPEFTVEMLDGSKITLSELRGKVVLVNFWATWCPPCRQEMSLVQNKIIDRFAGRDLIFLPISRGEAREAVVAFCQKYGYTFPVGLDLAQTIYDRYATNYIPRNFLIGRDGKIVLTSVGYDTREFEELIQTIEKTLE